MMDVLDRFNLHQVVGIGLEPVLPPCDVVQGFCESFPHRYRRVAGGDPTALQAFVDRRAVPIADVQPVDDDGLPVDRLGVLVLWRCH